MPKQKGLVKFEGTIDGLTFYRNSEGHFVRMAGGVSKTRIMNDPAFARTRENISEFGRNAQASKFLRDTAGIMVVRAKDGRTSNRLMKLFNKIKNLDGVSDRGQRKISIGMNLPEGKNILMNFDFNKNAQLRNILKHNTELDTATGSLSITQLIPNLHVAFPQGATHSSVSMGIMNVDFETEEGIAIQSNTENFPLDSTPIDISLTAVPPIGTGVTVFMILIEFFQEVNGKQYPLNNGAFNVLNVLEII